jgi:predicted MFS family arabinose efflux permease
MPGPGIFVVAQLTAGVLGLVLFGEPLAFATAVALAALLTFANSASRPGILAYGADLAPSQRGALFGLIALSNQSGLMVGSMMGAAVIGAGSYRLLGLISIGLGVLAAGLALPLARASRRPRP